MPWGMPQNPTQYPKKHVDEVRRTLDELTHYFTNYRVMSEAIGSSYEYLGQCWKGRVPGPAFLEKAKRMLALCQMLEKIAPDKIQVGWWLACTHFLLEDPAKKTRACPGRLFAEHDPMLEVVLDAAEDDFLNGSTRHRAAVKAARYQIPAHLPKDDRNLARVAPWFLLNPKTRRSLFEFHVEQGKASYPDKPTAKRRRASEPGALEELVGAVL